MFSRFQSSENSFLDVKWPENHENEVLFHVRPHQSGRGDAHQHQEDLEQVFQGFKALKIVF